MQYFIKFFKYTLYIMSLLPAIWSINCFAANTLSCSALNGFWQGNYIEKTQLYGQATPWPINFTIHYNPRTNIFNGTANTPFVPSAVTLTGKINYSQSQPAHIVGKCTQGKIQQLLLYTGNVSHCGHYTQPGGHLINANTLELIIEYEFSMNEAHFIVSLHKDLRHTAANKTEQVPTMDKLPEIKTCH